MQLSKQDVERNTEQFASSRDKGTRSKSIFGTSHMIHAAIVAALLVSAITLSPAFAAPATDATMSQADAQAKEAWRESMRHAAPQEKGCFHASYPSLTWTKEECGTVSGYRSARRSIPNDREQTVGNGNDDAVQAPTGNLFSEVVGSFPAVTGVKSEKDPGYKGYADGESNQYTLQLNTNFDYSAAACNGYQDGDDTGCYSWQQYILISNDWNAAGTVQTGTTDVFIQTWLENYGYDVDGGNTNVCPSGFIDSGADSVGPGDDCYENSPSTVVSKTVLPVTDLANLKVTGTATANGTDKAIVTYGGEAYSSSISDSVSDIASGWNQSEFNVVGNGGGSAASFNSGSSLTVKLAVDDGSTTAPTCVANDGTTGETNNLKLGKCTSTGGSSPAIQFTESN